MKATRNAATSIILISIHPEHVINIFNGSKKYEYRRKVPQNVKKLIIYETSPTKKIVGEVNIVKILALSPRELWNATKKHSCISKSYFDLYFCDKSIAYAYELGKIKKYNKPKTLAQFRLKVAPQSYAYIV